MHFPGADMKIIDPKKGGIQGETMRSTQNDAGTIILVTMLIINIPPWL
jgi:hypothetical protein